MKREREDSSSGSMLIQRVRKKKVLRERNRWVADVIGSTETLLDSGLILRASRKPRRTFRGGSLCAVCKGSRLLCGKPRCPLILRLSKYLENSPRIRKNELYGNSPPGVFIGRAGYPYVFAGPLVPPLTEDTSLYDTPELWFGKSMEEIVGFRSLLVRGKHLVNVKKPERGGRILEKTRELALSVRSIDVEVDFKDKPRKQIILDDNVQPFGPSATILKMEIGNPKWDWRIEKAYYDIDLRASEAVLDLYYNNVLVSRIQKAFSVGAFGVEKARRLVPTRWSITAVDSIISKDLIRRVKRYPEINEFRVYESTYLDNRFEILMIPAKWSYEAMEAWYPGTIWNPTGKTIAILSDWEGYDGRTTYADIGGCYYSARLAVLEKLNEERRQATVVVLREARPGYIMPVGVWQVRENVRNAMRKTPLKFNTLKEALSWMGTRFYIPIEKWIQESQILRRSLYQRTLMNFL